MAKPKKVKSVRVCPNCGSRATKIFNINSGKYLCQICEHQYDAPRRATRAEQEGGR